MNHYNEQEVWKDIPGYEGLYQASTFGRLRGLRFGKEKILKPGGQIRSGKEYFMIGLSKNKIKKNFSVSVLIAMTFMDFLPNGHNLVIDHLDSNPGNNRLDNLKIVTNRQNLSKERTLKSGLPVGVFAKGNRFLAHIRNKPKRINLGSFKTVEEASAAYQSALTKINNNEL
jgi:hypothetical protein